MRWNNSFLFLTVFVLSAVTGHAQEHVKYTPVTKTPAAIFSYLEGAVALIQEKGEVAFNELTDPNGPWVEGDWYLFVNSFEGYNVAHVNKKIVGKFMFGLRDIKGNAFFAELQKAAMSESGRGKVVFWWPKFGETEPSRKTGYVIKVPGRRLWVGTGAYDVSSDKD